VSGRHAAPDDGAEGGADGGAGGGGNGGAGRAANGGAAGAGVTSPSAGPTLRIIRGNPTPEEVAAVTVVLTALSGGGGELEQPARPGGWSDPALRLRRPIHPGPGAWQMSSWL
jgi:hypothetical protein